MSERLRKEVQAVLRRGDSGGLNRTAACDQKWLHAPNPVSQNVPNCPKIGSS
jgi:hypothetical protein